MGEMYLSMSDIKPDAPKNSMNTALPMMPPDNSCMVACRPTIVNVRLYGYVHALVMG